MVAECLHNIDNFRGFYLSPTPAKLIAAGFQLLSGFDHLYVGFQR